ncbi:hypothetical protein KEJ27_10475 [Candidatus Bathyarchaeota archaeon]|nr:hypothetical protein [Candidatus Bathyarchaeota archaeon]
MSDIGYGGRQNKWDFEFRAIVDYPVSLNKEPGYNCMRLASEFQPQPVGVNNEPFQGTWQDPVSKVILLKPSFTDNRFWNNSYWIRSTDWVGGSHILKGMRTHYELPVVGYTAVDPLEGRQIEGEPVPLPPGPEDWAWTFRTPQLEENEGWVLYWFSSADPLTRTPDRIFIQLDNYGFRIRRDGEFTVWLLDNNQWIPTFIGGRLTVPQDYSWLIACIPIPYVGLSFQIFGVSRTGDTDQPIRIASRGDNPGLVVWRTTEDVGGEYQRITPATVLRIASDPDGPAIAVGLHRIRYTVGTGTYVDGGFDPYYKPTVSPTVDPYISRPATGTNITLEVMGSSGIQSYNPNSHRVGRVRATLSTGTATYTPFLRGYKVSFSQVPLSRTTTPLILPDRTTEESILLRGTWLTATFRSYRTGKRDGTLEWWIEDDSPLYPILMRGDFPILFEMREGAGNWTPWMIMWGTKPTLTRETYKLHGQPRRGWRVKIPIQDPTWRLDEMLFLSETAFDDRPIADCINEILRYCGFTGLTSAPAEAYEKKLPSRKADLRWKYGPRAGDTARRVINLLLWLLKDKDTQYRLIYKLHPDPTQSGWILEKFTRPTTAPVPDWYFGETTQVPSGIPPEKYSTIAELKLYPESPEGNLLIAATVTEVDDRQLVKYAGAIKNSRSLLDPTYNGYLGRYKPMVLLLPGDELPQEDLGPLLTDWAWRVARVAGIPRYIAEISSWHTTKITPGAFVQVVRYDGTPFISPGFWVSQIEQQLGPGQSYKVQYRLDTLWEDLSDQLI